MILTSSSETIFKIQLNRPDKRNAINLPMLQMLGDSLLKAERTPGIRTILLSGEGPGFSSGIDLYAFGALAETYGENWQANMMGITAVFQEVSNRIERCSLPVISLLHGYALGLGFELALACDFRIAAQGTRVGLPETRLGIIPDVGGTTRLTRLVGPARAKELILTGKIVDLEQIAHWGLVNAIVPPAELEQHALELAGEIAQAAPLAVSAAKRVIDGLVDIDRGLQLEAWAQNHLIQSQDFQKGIQAAITRQAPEWSGK